ncbi:MAG: hypothetical protein WBA72_03830, partial [Ornithinimicrobium sp.]
MVYAPYPQGASSAVGPFGTGDLYPQPVFRIDGQVLPRHAVAHGPESPFEFPGESSMIGVMLAPRSVTDPKVEVLPTLVFDTPEGPRWSDHAEPLEVSVDEMPLRVAMEDELGLWAVDCNGSQTAVGQVGTRDIGLIVCDELEREDRERLTAYGVMALPTEVASAAHPLTTGPGTDAELMEVGSPQTTELADGLSLLVVPLDSSGVIDEGSFGRA